MLIVRKRLLYALLGAAACAAAAVFFACVAAWHATALFAAGAVALLLLAVRLSQSYRAARLITDNPILQVGVASVSKADEDAAAESSVVVSGFGILLDGKPYRFGQSGSNLTVVTIDREHITLTFGDEGSTYSVRLLHGIADKAEIAGLTERLRYETGIAAQVSGW